MDTKEIREKFIDYYDGKLSFDENELVARKLAENPELRQEFEMIAAISAKLKQLPQVDVPSDKLRARFDRMIAEEKQTLDLGEKNTAASQTSTHSHKLVWFSMRLAYTAAILAMGIFLGVRFNTSSQTTTSDNSSEIAALRTQIADMNQMITHSLLQQKSTSERVETVLATLAQGEVNRQLLTDLVGTLALDPSMNVRLSALEALSPYANEDLVRAGLHAALPRESVPLVQIAMIELLAGIQDVESVPIIEKIYENNGTDPNVRATARRALGTLEAINEENNTRTESFIL